LSRDKLAVEISTKLDIAYVHALRLKRASIYWLRSTGLYYDAVSDEVYKARVIARCQVLLVAERTKNADNSSGDMEAQSSNSE